MASRAQLASAVDLPLAAATSAGKARRQAGVAVAAEIDEGRPRRLRIRFASGMEVLVPVARLQGLGKATPAQRQALRLTGGGQSLWWPELDIAYSIPDLIAGLLGSRAWMAALGRHAGKQTSAAKKLAAQRNGRKGGRPRKVRADGPKPSARASAALSD